MVRHSAIKWRNIYYMLTYAIDELGFMQLGDIETEDCGSLDNLLASIMCRAMELLERNDYLREYIKKQDIIDKYRGTLDIQKTFGTNAHMESKLCCNYFELNNDNIYNQIIKKALSILNTRGSKISLDRHIIIKRHLEELSEISEVEIDNVNLGELEYSDLQPWYRTAISASKLVIEQLLGMDKEGNYLLLELSDDERLNYIFEKFVREFLQLEYDKAETTDPVYNTESGRKMLDILMECRTKALIIDTKWYSKTSHNKQSNNRELLDYGETYSSLERGNRTLNCLILYAKTEEKIRLARPNTRFAGEEKEFTIYECIIDLNQEFDKIKKDLIEIVEKYL